MKCFFRKVILVVIVAMYIATSFVYAEELQEDTVKTRTFVRNDWVFIKEKGKFMHTSLYDDGTVVATRDMSFPSTFKGISGYYATDQEGYMILGYVLFEDKLYYFQTGGMEIGKLLAGKTIMFNGKEYDIDEYGRIQGNLKDFFEKATIYTMGLFNKQQ